MVIAMTVTIFHLEAAVFYWAPEQAVGEYTAVDSSDPLLLTYPLPFVSVISCFITAFCTATRKSLPCTCTLSFLSAKATHSVTR